LGGADYQRAQLSIALSTDDAHEGVAAFMSVASRVDRQVSACCAALGPWPRGRGGRSRARGAARRAARRLARKPRAGTWEEDLRDSFGCLLRRADRSTTRLDAGARRSSSPASARWRVARAGRRRDHPMRACWWLDAHGDFTRPRRPAPPTRRHVLAGACGLWTPGFGTGPEPARVIMSPACATSTAASALRLDRCGVHRVRTPRSSPGSALRPRRPRRSDPARVPGEVPAPGGLSPAGCGRSRAVTAVSGLVGADHGRRAGPRRARCRRDRPAAG